MKRKSILVLSTALIISGIAQAAYFQDNFDNIFGEDGKYIDYLGWLEGGDWSIGGWDGFQSLPDPETGQRGTIEAYNYVSTYYPPEPWEPGIEPVIEEVYLRIVTANCDWNNNKNTGAFLYKNVTGDFIAEVEIVEWEYTFPIVGGLMARKANPDGEGENENWMCLSFIKPFLHGHYCRNTINGVTSEYTLNLEFPHNYLQLSRIGDRFYFKTKAEPEDEWVPFPSLEEGIMRSSLTDELQVGIWHASPYIEWVTLMDFDNFVLIPEPGTFILLSLGSVVFLRRRRQ